MEGGRIKGMARLAPLGLTTAVRVLVASTSIFAAGQASAATSDCGALEIKGQVSSKSFGELLSQNGAQGLLHRLRACETQWEAFLNALEGGRSEWLQVAAALLPVSDGAVTEDLAHALSVAFPRAPAGVLAAAESIDDSYGVCGDGETLGKTPAQAAAMLAQRRRAAESLKGESMRKAREACLKGIAFTEALLRDHPEGWSWPR
jgi:hypothetical protein